MKKLNLIFLLTIMSCAFCLAQGVKFGKITQEELEMTTYEKDTAASAVVLYEELLTRYEYDSQTFFKVVNNYFVRIKILTNEGLAQADQFISRYIASSNLKSESVSGISGFTYNLVNGKIENTKLSKEHIFEEKTSEYVARTKFAFQSVKVGSVIEYKYELTSPSFGELKDYYFQRSIPVKYSKYTLKIPEYFYFSKETRGMEPISLNTKSETQTINVQGEILNFSTNVFEFVTRDLPGLKDENYVWCIRDYLSRVTFELHSFIIPGSVHENYTNTWDKVDEKLLEHSNFGKQFNHKLFKEELSGLLTDGMTNAEKVKAIYDMVKAKVKWNDENTFSVKNPRDALKKGIGTSGEINAILISALREAGFDAYPVAMRLRNTGRIPLTHPTLDGFNYFVVGVDIDEKSIFMDASSKYGDLNVMSTYCLSDFSRSVRAGNRSDWVDLSSISKSVGLTTIFAKFNENGELSGKVMETFSNQLGYALHNIYSESKDEQEFFDEIASSQDMEITSHVAKNIGTPTNRVEIEYDFIKKEVIAGEEYIYFNPLIFPLYEENPFKAEDRKLPVEFSYPYERRHTVIIDIPEGYQVEGISKPTKVVLNEEKDVTYQYIMAEDKATGKINVSLHFALNRIHYLQEEYQLLRDFFLHLATSNNEQIVLKKIMQ